MAQVLLCEDEKLGRLVAVKRLHAESADDVERRFLREARLGAALNHPNLVSVFDTVVDADGLLIVMEYVEGEPLARAVRRGPLDARRVARMARDVAAGLDHAHSHGVVHRDVKPGNVLLRNDGVAKLADLGIATAVDLTRITRSGELLGTAAYMAPEQLEGGEAGPASDVYALAAVCFEALTGERPRHGRSAVEVAHRIATEPPPDLLERLPSAPPAAGAALQRAMARDPGERPGSAGALAAELAAALEDSVFGPQDPVLAPAAPTRRLRAAALPTRAPRQAPPPVRPPPARGPRRAAALIPMALLALAAAAAAAVLLMSGSGDAQDPSPRAQDTPEAGTAPAQRPKQDKKNKDRKSKDRKDKQAKQEAERPPEPAVSEPPAAGGQTGAGTEATSTVDPAVGTQLNEQGFALMNRGDYAGAVPLLQRAVSLWPTDSTDLQYGYALFNLGKALNRSGRASEAIPYLEKRLNWDDQRGTVEAELDLARQNAGQG